MYTIYYLNNKMDEGRCLIATANTREEYWKLSDDLEADGKYIVSVDTPNSYW